MSIVDGGNAFSTYGPTPTPGTAPTDIAAFFVHEASVATSLGQTGYGIDQYATPVSAAGFLDGASKLIRDQNGQQVVASATWFTYATDLNLYTPDSIVQVNNVTGHVLSVAFHDSGSLGLPDHLEVYLV